MLWYTEEQNKPASVWQGWTSHRSGGRQVLPDQTKAVKGHDGKTLVTAGAIKGLLPCPVEGRGKQSIFSEVKRKKMKKIILANLNGHKLSFKLSLPQQSQREKERLFSMQITSPGKKILPWGLMALRESDLNGYCPKRKSPYLRFGRK